MKEKAIIWGAGNTGKSAYYALKEVYEIEFFVDSDPNKWGGESIDGKIVYSPDIMQKSKKEKLIIASIYKDEILKVAYKYRQDNILIYSAQCDDDSKMHSCHDIHDIFEELNNRTIDLGLLLSENRIIKLKELTFMPGGSGVLDYAFIKHIAEKYQCRKYLEIGTYIGESINILTDTCECLYSITAPPDSKYGMRNWCKKLEIPDFSNRLIYSDKIKQWFVEDSKQFDYSILPSDITLFFIDGNHSYDGVYWDTKNIFSIRNKDSIVIWHDFKKNSRYNSEVIYAVKDVLGEDFKNVYVTNNNMCGIFLPQRIQKEFVCKKTQFRMDELLYTFDVDMNLKIKHV